MKKLIYSLAALTLAACSAEKQEPIDVLRWLLAIIPL